MTGSRYVRFGHLRLSLFYSHVVTIHERGFIFKGKNHLWTSIENVRVWQEPWPGFGQVPDAKLLPRAIVSLDNGQYMRIRGDALVKRDGPPNETYKSPFDELIALFIAKHQQYLKQYSNTDNN